MSARRSEEAQAAILAAAREALNEGHHLRALRLVTDARRLGPWSEAMEMEARALDDAVFPVDHAA